MQSTGQRWNGYTLIELMVVVALIAFLMSLVLSGITSARHAAYTIKCTSQLRQVGIAFRMYLEDNDGRPLKLSDLVDTGYLDKKLLVCPVDITGNYSQFYKVRLSVPCSYYYPSRPPLLPPELGEIAFWNILMQDSNAGISACQLHGSKVREVMPSLMFEGLVLRLRRDGAVVRRQVFVERIICPGNAVRCYSINFWRLLSDLPPPPLINAPVPCCN